MAKFTAAAAIALIRGIEQAGIAIEWPSFVAAYDLMDPGVERPHRGVPSVYEGPPAAKRLQRLKDLAKRTSEPEMQRS